MIVSRKVFATELNVSISRIAHYAALGMPTLPGVGVDRDKALAWVRDNVQPQGGEHQHKAAAHVSEIMGEGTGNGHNGARLDPAQERGRRDRAWAERLEMENLVRARELCEISAVTAVIARDYQITRNRLMSVGFKVAPLVAACRSAEECKAIIDAEILKAMEELTADSAYDEIERQARAAAAGG